MSSSGYNQWAVTAGEIPTTAYWNLLGSNDASFNTGNGFNDSIIVNRHLSTNSVQSPNLALSNVLDPTNGIQTYTPTMSGQQGGTWAVPVGFYINLGGMKLCWGTVSYSATATTGRCTVSLPTSFFASWQIGVPAIVSEGNSPFQVASGDSIVGSPPSTFGFYVSNTANASSCVVSWWIVGT